MQRIIGYECFLENTLRDLCEQLAVPVGQYTHNCNFVTDAIKNTPMGKCFTLGLFFWWGKSITEILKEVDVAFAS